jgi:isochorismate pyruvate lyase
VTRRCLVTYIALAALAVATVLPIAALADEPSTTTPAYRGSPTVDGGKCCTTLGEVRDNIDRIDRAIIGAMAERSKYVHEAARFKKNPAEVEAPQRVEQVVRKAMALAAEDGLPPEVAEATYRAMVHAFTAYEQGVFAKQAR